jgi:MSHA biogenesis protein MshM
MRMAVDLVRLRALPPGQYAIQLMTADPREKAAIEDFLRAASRELNPDRIMIYPAGTAERPQLSVLYGSYTERADANSEIARLPARLKKFSPYARSIQAIRDDVRGGR